MSSNSSVINISNPSKNILSIVMIGLAIIIIFFLIYSTYVGYKNYQTYSPYLINGITDATIPQKFSGNQIKLPSDSQWGTEFTYSFWIFIKDVNFSSTAALTDLPNSSCKSTELPMLHVFHKGSYDYITNGNSSGNSNINYPLLQMPGVWLYPNTNKLNIRFNTYQNVVETADIGNIPLNMWVNVIIILIGSSVDIYVNGNLKKRAKLNGVPKINYGDFYTTNWGGFQGYLSRLRYFNTAIQPFMVDQIFQMGPSKEFATNITQSLTSPGAQLSSKYWLTTGYPNSNFPQQLGGQTQSP
jgi:hypothetical protein